MFPEQKCSKDDHNHLKKKSHNEIIVIKIPPRNLLVRSHFLKATLDILIKTQRSHENKNGGGKLPSSRRLNVAPRRTKIRPA